MEEESTRTDYINIIDSLAKNVCLSKLIDSCFESANVEKLDADSFYHFLYFGCLRDGIKVSETMAKYVFTKLDVEESGGISK